MKETRRKKNQQFNDLDSIRPSSAAGATQGRTFSVMKFFLILCVVFVLTCLITQQQEIVNCVALLLSLVTEFTPKLFVFPIRAIDTDITFRRAKSYTIVSCQFHLYLYMSTQKLVVGQGYLRSN